MSIIILLFCPYDESGICGMNYNGTDYVFEKNLLGDVVAIYNTSGTLQGTYAYDAWGNILAQTNNAIVDANPFRYRSYYYDVETRLYYLNSRYYDPQTGRFINADNPASLLINAQTCGGANLFSYCLNNPVSYVDSDGTGVLLLFIGLILLNGLIQGGINVWFANGGENRWALFVDGFIDGVLSGLGLAAGFAIGGPWGLIVAAAGGFFGGYFGSVAYQQMTYGDVDWNTAAVYGIKSAVFNIISYFALYEPVNKGLSFLNRLQKALTPTVLGVGLNFFNNALIGQLFSNQDFFREIFGASTKRTRAGFFNYIRVGARI